MNCKFVAIFLLLVATALAWNPPALNISAPVQVLTVNQGDVADYMITIKNQDTRAQNITLYAESDVPTSFSLKAFPMNPGEVRDVHLFAVTNGIKEGVYLIEVAISNDYYIYDANFSVGVFEGAAPLMLNSVYEEISLEQGDFKDLKFVLTNDGDEYVRNIVISGDISERLSPEYPRVFDLAPGATADINVRIEVPRDYPAENYELTVRAASGSLEAEAKTKLAVKKEPILRSALDIQKAGVAQLKQNDSVVGYSLVLRVKNGAGRDIQDVDVVVENVTDIVVSGQENFDIQRFETKDIELRLRTNNFNEQTAFVRLLKDDISLANATVVLSGSKIGMPTGMFYLGSSLTIGLMFLAVAVVVLLYVRERGKRMSVEAAARDEAYLTSLDGATVPGKAPGEQTTIEG